MNNMLSIHLNGSYTRLAFISNEREVLAHEENLSVVESAEDIVDALKAFILKYPDLSFKSIGVAIDANISKKKEEITESMKFPFLVGFDLKQYIYQELGSVCIIINEVRAKGSYLIEENNLYGQGDSVIIDVGESINSAMFINNRIVEGANGNAGMIAHTHMYDKTHSCLCGKVGCYHMYSSIEYLKLLHAVHCNSFGQIDFSNVFCHNKSFDVADKYCDGLASVISPVLNTVDPDNLVLTGEVFNIKGFPREHLLSKLDNYTAEGAGRLYVRDSEGFKTCIGLFDYNKQLNERLKKVSNEY